MTTIPLHVYSDAYPPRNRIPTGLGVTDIEIVDAQGKHRYNPNSAIMAAHKRSGFALGEPVGHSDISGEPGYIVRLDAVQLTLSAKELVRLFMRSLRPEEFFAIARKYGVFYEISSKFYDEDTGIALDPRLTFEEQETRLALAKVPHLLLIPGSPPSVHSIVTLSQADQLIPTFSETFSLRAVALPLQKPEHPSVSPAALKPVGNIVTLFTHEDGSQSVFGPFNSVEDAESFTPSTTSVMKPVRSRTTAHSVVAACGSTN